MKSALNKNVMLNGLRALRPATLGALLLLLGAAQVAANVTPQDVADLRELVTQSEELKSAAADDLLGSLKQADSLLVQLDKQRNYIVAYQDEVESFTDEAASLDAQIQALLTAPPANSAIGQDETSLQTATEQLQISVRQKRQALFEARELDARLRGRAVVIGEQMTAAAARLNASKPAHKGVSLNLSPGSPQAVQPLALQVQTLLERTKSHVAIETLGSLQSELSTLAPRQTLATLRSRLLQLQLDSGTRQLYQHVRLLNQMRVENAQSRLSELHKQSTSASVQVDPVHSNATIERIRWVTAEVALLKQELPLLQRTLQLADEILKIYQVRQIITQINGTGAVNDSLADMVREQRNQLPDTSLLVGELQQLTQDQRQLQVKRILWESELRESGNNVTIAATAETSPRLPSGSLADLIDLLGITNRVEEQMVTLKAVLTEAQIRAEEVGSTLDGSVLWLRTNESVGLGWLNNVLTGLRWIVSPSGWSGLGSALLHGVQAKLVSSLLLVLTLLLLIAYRGRISDLLRRSAVGVGNVGEDRYWSTPSALAASALWALPIPLFMTLFYWVLQNAFVVSGTLIPALTDSLLATITVLTVLLFFKALCRYDGVFVRHFEWNQNAVRRLNKHLTWFIWVCTLCTALFSLALFSGRPELRYGLGVGAFIAVSVAMSMLLHVCLRPDRGVAFTVSGSQTRSPFTRLAIWTLILVPIGVGLLPLVGYFDTAVEIQSRAFRSGVYLMATIVLIALLIREFTVAHRRMSLRKARAKRAHREAERAAQQNAPVSGDATPDLSFAWDDDYKRVAHQAQKLFKIAGVVLFLFVAWLVWKPLFPVLDVFNDIELWRAAEVSGGITGGQSVTLGKLLFALGVVVLGIVGSRNLRGVLEIVVFERLKLDTGARYAINAIASYALIGTTLLIGIAQMGVDWSRLQWIVAALGVGLGFGLQEIVANFISGLIILFERPVRVGDTVTIGGLSGTVSNIQIRATTLTDFDNREVLLPNKSIITENVTNWTLHDAVTRILLCVGVAYGSDIEQVQALLLECVVTTDDVLTTPEPTVFFVNHGASSLDFEIRSFVATPAHRLPVTHALNASINKSLEAHGIDIPFPQRVVHVR